ncbi:hypothetical protein ROJ8625_00596 [Roseivivax jejudonensis]|uniref:Uncharacterized protein n=1 Tax=Roseivivax jejudonensis TaxID=1529041 RepID=A0A1X6YDM3_9RHOB|nr:hypothetical protein [Roseivivax jejudonensis]SLN17958.1 hypothetical protein ROJ8625_00596 [Roseivivax jejudonensis]
MPLQNRVTPAGEILALDMRGTLMGNRGILHDDDRRLGAARWRHRAWIACRLSFRGRRRAVMTPGRYTELFFTDEAVAFAAGHRPCAECRRADYLRFRAAFAAAHPELGPAPRAAEMDRVLHAARIEPGSRAQRRFLAAAETLPPGTFVLSSEGAPCLLLAEGAALWSVAGYRAVPRPLGQVTVMTPEPIVRAVSAGYDAASEARFP